MRSREASSSRLAVVVFVVLALAGMRCIGPSPAVAAKPPPAGGAATDSLGDPLPTGARLRLGTVRFRPPSGVAEMALAPDEKTLVTVGNEVVAWNTATGAERWRTYPRDIGLNVPGASYGLRAIAFGADSRNLYSTGGDGTIREWDTVTRLTHNVLRKDANNGLNGPERQAGARSVDVTPDGRLFALGGPTGVVVCRDDGAILYEIANNAKGQLEFKPKHGDKLGKVILHVGNRDRLTFGGHYSFVRFSPDGKRLAIVTSDTPEAIRLLDSQTGEELRRIELGCWLVRLAFTPDGKQICATERDCAVRLYDVETGKELWSHVVELRDPYENYTSAVAISPDGKIVAACATDCRIYLLDAATGQELGTLKGHHWYPWALVFTADSKMLYSSGWDGAVRRWDMTERKQLPPPAGIRGTGVVAASPDGKSVAYQDDGGTIHLVDAADGAERRTLEQPDTKFSQVCFSLDGRQLAGGGTSGDNVQVTVFDVLDGRVIHHWDWPKGRDPHSTVECLAFSPTGHRLAAAVFRQSSAYLWDLTTDERIAQIPHDQIYGLSFSPDGQTLATAGWDSTVRFWGAETGASHSTFKITEENNNRGDLRMYTVSYGPRGGLVATAHLDGTVRIWNAEDMALRNKLQVNGRFIFGAMSFSPDGLWLATGSMSGNVTVWDPVSTERVWESGHHQGYVYTVGFGRAGRTLVSGGADGVGYLWDLGRPGQPMPPNPARVWDALAGEDGPAAFQAMCELAETPDQAVALLGEKLRAVKFVIDTGSTGGAFGEEAARRQRLAKLLVDKQTNAIRSATARRAMSLLVQINTPEAIELLKELATRDPSGDIGRQAAAALKPPAWRE
jgi:WD40 repeat protein